MEDQLICYNMGLGQDSAAIAALYTLGRLPASYYEIPKERSFFVFSDTGAELRPTYAWKKLHFEPWLDMHGITLHTLSPDGPYHACGPSPKYPDGRVMMDIIAEHMKDAQPSFPTRSSARCTTNAKGRPLSNFRDDMSRRLTGLDNRKRAAGVLSGKAGPNLVAIGYAVDELERAKASDANHSAKNWTPVYPLIELGMTRSECRDVIREAGLEVPMKSGCTCCPWAPTWHFYWLLVKYEEDFLRVEEMENAAIAQKTARGDKPYFIKEIPIRAAALAWHHKHPTVTVDEIETWMYERDVYTVGRRCTLETEGSFCNFLDLDTTGFEVIEHG